MQNNYFGWAWYEATYFCVALVNSKWQVTEVKGKFGPVVCHENEVLKCDVIFFLPAFYQRRVPAL